MGELVAARDWLTVFQLPPYASELNPVESVWSHLKRSLANLAKRDLAQLTALAKTRLRRMQYQPGLVEASSPEPGSTSCPSVTFAIEDRLVRRRAGSSRGRSAALAPDRVYAVSVSLRPW
jgi:hypothetical protein